MPNFIDCHNHLCAADFEKDLDDVIERAKQAGVAHALVVAENAADFERIFNLAERQNVNMATNAILNSGLTPLARLAIQAKGPDGRYPNFCLPCLGVHPVQGEPTKEQRSITQQDIDEAMPWIEKYHDKIVAIGEIGLDFSPRICKTDEDKASQKHALTTWVEIGKKYNLPLSIHSRSAGRPTIALLKETGACNVLLHAFDGRPSVAMEGVKAGYYFSIPPSIVRSDQKKKLVERLPLESLLLETDCPALGPEKQVRNEPSNIQLSCEYIARIKNVDIETVAQVVWENSLKLFPRIRQFIVK